MAPQCEHHEVQAVVQLQGEPVPADVLGGEHAAAPLPVEPAKAGDGDGAGTLEHFAGDGDARHGIVVGGVVRPLGREAAIALRHRCTATREREVEAELAVTRVEAQGIEGGAGGREPPAIDPQRKGCRLDAGQPRVPACQPLGFQMPRPGHVRQRQVPHVDLRRAPAVRAATGHQPLAEKRELGTVLFPRRRGQCGGEIPPLGAEVRVCAVVGRKRQRHDAFRHLEAGSAGAERVRQSEPPGRRRGGLVGLGVWRRDCIGVGRFECPGPQGGDHGQRHRSPALGAAMPVHSRSEWRARPSRAMPVRGRPRPRRRCRAARVRRTWPVAAPT